MERLMVRGHAQTFKELSLSCLANPEGLDYNLGNNLQIKAFVVSDDGEAGGQGGGFDPYNSS